MIKEEYRIPMRIPESWNGATSQIQRKRSLALLNIYNNTFILFYSNTTGGGNDELNADGGKSIKLLKFTSHRFNVSNA